MRVQSIFLVLACGTLVLSCSEGRNSPPEASARPGVAATESPATVAELRWPDVIVAERNQFLPEGIEYDPVNSRFLVGSLREGTVFEMGRDGRLTPAVEDPELVSSVGIEVDAVRGRLLVVNSDSSVFSSERTGQAKLGVFDLSSGERLAMIDLATTIEDRTEKTVFFANDVTVDDEGAIYVTDTRTGGLQGLAKLRWLSVEQSEPP